MRAFMRF